MVSSDSELKLSSAVVTLAELEPQLDKDFKALLDDLPVNLPDDLPNDLPDEPLDIVLDMVAFSSCSCLGVWHSETS